MKLPSMFKTPTYRSFKFKTRYYDAEKEAFEERVNRIKQTNTGNLPEAEAAKLRIRDHFQNKKKARITGSKKSNLTIIIIIAILSALSFWILK